MLILEAGRGNDFYFKIFQVISLMLEDPELFLSDKIVTIITSFVTVQSFCIARMVFERRISKATAFMSK